MATFLDVVGKYTELSIDTMFAEKALEYEPKTFTNATSNQRIILDSLERDPTLVTKAAELAIAKTPASPGSPTFINEVIFFSIALIGQRMLPNITGCVLGQVLPQESYDTDKTVAYARGIIRAYEAIGVSRDRVIIKLPMTFETAHAAKILKETYHIKTLGTVVHSLAQAIISAEAGCVAISPYVDNCLPESPPTSLKDNYGLNLTKDIHNYYHSNNVKTQNVIAALMDLEVLADLIGVDGMTIPTPSLERLKKLPAPKNFVPPLTREIAPQNRWEPISYINDKKKYLAAHSAEAQKRISFTINHFTRADAEMRDFIKSELKKARIL